MQSRALPKRAVRQKARSFTRLISLRLPAAFTPTPDPSTSFLPHRPVVSHRQEAYIIPCGRLQLKRLSSPQTQSHGFEFSPPNRPGNPPVSMRRRPVRSLSVVLKRSARSSSSRSLRQLSHRGAPPLALMPLYDCLTHTCARARMCVKQGEGFEDQTVSSSHLSGFFSRCTFNQINDS